MHPVARGLVVFADALASEAVKLIKTVELNFKLQGSRVVSACDRNQQAGVQLPPLRGGQFAPDELDGALAALSR
jgi:hypothetical protein